MTDKLATPGDPPCPDCARALRLAADASTLMRGLGLLAPNSQEWALRLRRVLTDCPRKCYEAMRAEMEAVMPEWDGVTCG